MNSRKNFICVYDKFRVKNMRFLLSKENFVKNQNQIKLLITTQLLSISSVMVIRYCLFPIRIRIGAGFECFKKTLLVNRFQQF